MDDDAKREDDRDRARRMIPYLVAISAIMLAVLAVAVLLKD